MTEGLKTIKPLVISDSTLIAAPSMEDPAPAWVPGSPYSEGAMVRYQHVVYKTKVGTSGMTPPPLDGTVWIKQYPTNTWSLFDPMTSKATIADNVLVYEFKFGQTCGAIIADGLENVQTVRLTITDPTFDVVYERSVNVGRTITRSSWYLWHNGPRELTGVLGYFTDLPDYPQSTIKIEFLGSLDMKVRNLIAGSVQEWGFGAENGASISFEDYSVNQRDEYGELTLVPRRVIRETNMSLTITRREVDGFVKFIQDRAAKPTFFVASRDLESINTFGVATATIKVQYKDYSVVDLKVTSTS